MQNILDQLENLNEQQLIDLNRAVIGKLRRARAAKGRAVKMSLNEGDTVKWDGKNGRQTGTVKAIKRKFAHIDTAAGCWRVPMSMLHKV